MGKSRRELGEEKPYLTEAEALALGIDMTKKPSPPKKAKVLSSKAARKIKAQRNREEKAMRSESPHLYIPKPSQIALLRLNTLLGDLFSKWSPHQFQIDGISAIVVDDVKILVCETGRQVGKTEMIIVTAGLWSQLVPGSQSHYMAPLLNQARDILWDSGRIRDILPDNWIDDMKEKNSTVYFANSKNCTLKIDGADKFDKKRGISVKKGIVFIDEGRDMKEDVWPTVKPALGVYNCPAVFTSTPPKQVYPYKDRPKQMHWFYELADKAKVTPGQRHLFAKTEDNPHFPKHLIEEEKQLALATNKYYHFAREYEGQRVDDEVGRVWPMLLDSSRYVFRHEDLLREIHKDITKMQWYCMTDPAGSSVWAWLLVGVNPYTKMIYVIDEIYEVEKANMATSILWPRIKEKMQQIIPVEHWNKHYDEAETWFQNDIYTNYQVVFNPSYKTSKSKEEGFKLLTDIFLNYKIKFSDRAESVYWELKNYEDHKSPDHNVDNLRYFLNVSNFSMPSKDEPIDINLLSPAERRFREMTNNLPSDSENTDWQDKILNLH